MWLCPLACQFLKHACHGTVDSAQATGKLWLAHITLDQLLKEAFPEPVILTCGAVYVEDWPRAVQLLSFLGLL